MSTKAGEKYQLYKYEPSQAAAIVFIALFTIATAIHFFKLVKFRTYYFIPFVVGGIFEQLGYIGRMINTMEDRGDWSLIPYVLSTLTLLLGPALFAASIYMVLGRLILLVDGAHLSPIRVNWLTKIFVLGDVISFLAQCGGGGLLATAKTESQSSTYENIITGGLGIQLLFFGLFMVCTLIFHTRMRKMPTARSEEIGRIWETYIYVLYAASLLIMIRSVFRIAEYVMGQDGFLLQHEYFLYVFDATLMFLVMVIFIIWHPSAIIEGRRRKLDAESFGSHHELRGASDYHPGEVASRK